MKKKSSLIAMAAILALTACTKKTEPINTCLTPTYNVTFISNGVNAIDQIDYVNITAYSRNDSFTTPVDSVKNVLLTQSSTGATFDFMATTHKSLLPYDWKFVAMPSGRVFYISHISPAIVNRSKTTLQLMCVGANIYIEYKQNDTLVATAGNNGSNVANLEIRY